MTGLRSTQRDTWYSERHFGWGSSMTACDIDFLEFRYDKGVCTPVAIIETKHDKETIDTKKPAIAATEALAKLANLPYFIVSYTKTPAPRFNVWARNDQAEEALWEWLRTRPPRVRLILDHDEKDCRLLIAELSEADYVLFQYFLRGQEPDPKLIASIRARPSEKTA